VVAVAGSMIFGCGVNSFVDISPDTSIVMLEDNLNRG